MTPVCKASVPVSIIKALKKYRESWRSFVVLFIRKSSGIRCNWINSKPVWLCQWVTCLSWQLYWWTLAESKVEYCMQKHSHFDTCLIFTVDCIRLTFCLFMPGTVCTGGRLAKTGVNSAAVGRLGHSSVQSADVPWNKGHELCSW